MYTKILKRIFDIALSILILPFFCLLYIILGFAIKFDDGGPIFYNGKRLGKEMKEFKMFKFRTMIVNAPDIRNKDGSTFNSENDSRLTRMGKFLRKTSLDEVPQILNVLKGDMSFVGPRPSPLGNKELYPNEFFKKFNVRPGITGYNQAMLRNNATMEQRVKNDVYYVENITFFFDLRIIWKTISTVIQRKNINKN